MNCAECQEQLVSYIEHLLDDAQIERVAEHVKGCAGCQAELEALQSLQDRLIADGQAVTQSDFEEEVMNRIIREQNVRLKSAAQANAGLRLRRFIMKSPMTRIAAAALVIVAVGIGISEIGGGTPAFAEVVKSILEARTATFRVVTNAPNQPAVTMEGEFMDPGLGRHTMHAAGVETIMILDYVQGKGLVLVPSQKIAMAMELEDGPSELDPSKINVFKVLRDRIVAAQENVDESVEYLGESQIDGQKVIGYRMIEDGADATIWAEVDSLLPLQIEYSMGQTSGEPVTVTMMDIKFNVPLDIAQFKMTVPEGYQEMTMQVDASEPDETDLVETLGLWVEITDGRFPSDLTLEAMKELVRSLEAKTQLPAGERPNLNDPMFKEFLQTFQKVNRSLMFVRNLPAETDWHYVGADAAYGDAATPVFWYRPEGSTTYRVIYADLSVVDVAPKDLPQ